MEEAVKALAEFNRLGSEEYCKKEIEMKNAIRDLPQNICFSKGKYYVKKQLKPHIIKRTFNTREKAISCLAEINKRGIEGYRKYELNFKM